MKGGGFLLKVLGFGLLALIIGITTTAIVIHIKGAITRKKLQEELLKKNINGVMITAINRCKNCLSLKDLDSGKTLQIQGDAISDDLHKKDRIYV